MVQESIAKVPNQTAENGQILILFSSDGLAQCCVNLLRLFTHETAALFTEQCTTPAHRFFTTSKSRKVLVATHLHQEYIIKETFRIHSTLAIAKFDTLFSFIMYSCLHQGGYTSFKLSAESSAESLPGHLSAAADSKTSPRNPVMCIVLHLENIASLDWILNCKFRPLSSQPLAVQSQ